MLSFSARSTVPPVRPGGIAAIHADFRAIAVMRNDRAVDRCCAARRFERAQVGFSRHALEGPKRRKLTSPVVGRRQILP